MTSTDIPSRARTALAPMPITFELYDDDNAPVICIDDGRVQRELHLELHNQSGADLEFDPPLNAPASRDNHHLELRFRPGILSQRALGVLTAPDVASRVLPRDVQSWDVAAFRGENGGPVSLFLLFKGNPRTLSNDRRLTLSLQELSAEAALGSRPTQVQLRVRALRFVQARTPITSTVHRHLNVLHWGRAEAPLRAGFIGTSTLVNTGTANKELRLRVRNTSASETLAAAPGSHARPSFALSFDVGDGNAWWALDAKAVEKALVISEWPNGTKKEEHVETPGALVPRWKIDLPDPGLGPGQHVEITIVKLEATGSGPTNLYLEYRDLPGYRHGRLVCQMQRAPLNDEMLAQLYAAVFETHDRELEAHTAQLSTMAGRIDAAAASLNTLSAEWGKWSGAKDDKGVPKLIRDVSALKAEAHLSTIPLDFSRAGCAYTRLATAPAYGAIVYVGYDAVRVKLGGGIIIPSLKVALESGVNGAAGLALPVKLAHDPQVFVGIVMPFTFVVREEWTFHGTFRLSSSGTFHLVGIDKAVPDELATKQWMVSLGQLNESAYD